MIHFGTVLNAKMQMKGRCPEDTLDLFRFIVDLNHNESRRIHEPIVNRPGQIKKSTDIETGRYVRCRTRPVDGCGSGTRLCHGKVGHWCSYS